jgi:hypothetical protein
MNHQTRIDYERLVEDYNKSLTTVLRGFKAGAEFLETWVPDEDDLKSILNILEAAEGDGVKEILIYIGSTTLRNLDLGRLKEFAGRAGVVEIDANGEGVNLKVSLTGKTLSTREWISEPRIKVPSKSGSIAEGVQETPGERACGIATVQDFGRSVHPVYREGLQKALQFCSHEGVLNMEPGVELVQAFHEDIVLAVHIEASNHRVRKARYQRPASDVRKGVLEVLCRIMEGKPILECSDHAVIYLEHELRDHLQPPPVPGVVTPENADPVFALPTLLVRKLLAEYRQRTGFTPTANFYDPPSSAQWRALSENERVKCIQVAIERHHAGRGMEVVGVEGLKRVVVKFNGEVDSAEKQKRLIQVESFIKNAIDPVLQVYMLPKVDQNKIRRINDGST